MKVTAINFYNNISSFYDREYQTPYWNLELWVSIKHILSFSDKDMSLLDIGAVTGTYASYLKKYFKSIYAIEPAENMLKEFKKKNPQIPIKKSKVERLPFDDNSFDIAVAMGDVLSYSENLDIALREIWRVLKPKGIFIASVDNYHYFLKDVLKYGTLTDYQKIVKTQQVTVGTLEAYFESRTFKYKEIIDMAKSYRFIHKDMIFKLVCFSEGDDIPNINQAIDVEFKLNRYHEYVGHAEHTQFVWQKE